MGPGKPDEECYRIISERNLKDIMFVGEVSEDDKVRYFHSADMFCSPATGGESLGIVLMEAMASGKPVVATDIEGCSTVITHGTDGFLVPPKNDEARADAIKLLLSDSNLRDQIAANGQARVEEFRWERVSKRVMGHYEKKLASPLSNHLKAPTSPFVLF